MIFEYGVRMVKNIINSIASDLERLDNEPNLPLLNPKLYSSAGILLEPYAKQNRMHTDDLKRVVKRHSFFKLGSTTIQTGLFSKRESKVPTIAWAAFEDVQKKYSSNPDKVLQDATGSNILIEKMVSLITQERSKFVFKLKPESSKQMFQYHQENRTALFREHFPEELEKYQREGKHETSLEKKFQKRVPAGVEFYFSNGKVAHNLLTWVQCLHMAPTDVIATHIKNSDFYVWLDGKVKVPELARIILMVKKRLDNDEISEKEVKNELLGSINKTSLNNIIFDTMIQPLIRTLKSNDQSKVQDAIDKLINIGDERVIEPMMDKIYDSSPQIRRKIIQGLGKLGDKRATPTLLKVLKHSTDNQDRVLIVKTLGILKDKRSLTTLEELAKNNDELGAEAKGVLEQILRTD